MKRGIYIIGVTKFPLLLGAVLCICVGLSKPATANCKVMESRNAYLGYSSMYGFSPALERVQNPYKTMMTSNSPSQVTRASQLLDAKLSQMGVDGPAKEVSEHELSLAQEQLGVQMLSTSHQADYALIYGSERIKPDGSMLVSYEQIDLNGPRAGERVEKILQVKSARTLEVLSGVCKNDRCNASRILRDPLHNQTAFKTVIGIEITRSLKLCKSTT